MSSKMGNLRKTKTANRHNNMGGYSVVTVFEDIKVTKHAIERHRERNFRYTVSDDEVAESIRSQVRTSRLYNINGNEERREKAGNIFVCKREVINGRPTLVVVTELLSRSRKLMNFGVAYI